MRSLFLFLLFFSASIADAATFTVETTEGGKTSESTITIADLEQEIQGLQERLDALLLSVINSERKPIVSGGSADTWIQDKIFSDSAEVDDAPDVTTFGKGAATYGELGGCVLEFATNYHLGDSGDEVWSLQSFLNRNSETRLREFGAGSPGQETNYFGSITFGAVKRFQSLYGQGVLESLGLNAPTGYWGPSTRKTANKLAGCSE